MPTFPDIRLHLPKTLTEPKMVLPTSNNKYLPQGSPEENMTGNLRWFWGGGGGGNPGRWMESEKCIGSGWGEQWPLTETKNDLLSARSHNICLLLVLFCSLMHNGLVGYREASHRPLPNQCITAEDVSDWLCT